MHEIENNAVYALISAKWSTLMLHTNTTLKDIITSTQHRYHILGEDSGELSDFLSILGLETVLSLFSSLTLLLHM